MKKARITLPEATANALANHPWASRILPNFQGQWFRSMVTGEVVFVAEVSEHQIQEFIAGLRLLEGRL